MAATKDTRGMPSLQLKDVYNIAQKVGEEFQSLIGKFGNSHTAVLVETVIAVLEHLENSVDLSNKLQIKHCQMLLDRDNLVRDKEEMKATLELREQENKKLKRQLEVVQSENEFLWTQQTETVTANPSSEAEVQPATSGLGEESQTARSSSYSSDAMEFPRMRRRMQQLENELRRTKTKLLSTQKTMQCIVAENNTLKYDLGLSRAEKGVLELELESHERRPGSRSSNDDESPKFFKNDLLSVLQEKNELKEELESAREELRMARLQLYQPSPPASNNEHPLCDDCSFTKSRVRTIVTSITVPSVKERSKTAPRKMQHSKS